MSSCKCKSYSPVFDKILGIENMYNVSCPNCRLYFLLRVPDYIPAVQHNNYIFTVKRRIKGVENA